MRCKDCKHWSRAEFRDFPNEPTLLEIGSCSKVNPEINYWETSDDVANKMNGEICIGGENVFTNENFGCILFENI